MDYSCEHVHGLVVNYQRYRWPYDYSKPGHEEDFVPQNVPMKPGEDFTSLDSKIFNAFQFGRHFFFLLSLSYLCYMNENLDQQPTDIIRMN
jgi:hypothetical protein